MRDSKFTWAALILIVILLGTAWIAYSRVPPEDNTLLEAATEAPIPGHLAPAFTLQTTSNESISLEEYRGKPVVLNFWATWCPPCRAEIPHFQEASEKYGDRAVVIGIDQGEPQLIVADFGASMGVPYPLLLDTDSG